MRIGWLFPIALIAISAVAPPQAVQLTMKPGVWQFTETITTIEPGKPPQTAVHRYQAQVWQNDGQTHSAIHELLRSPEGNDCRSRFLVNARTRARAESLCDYQLREMFRLQRLTISSVLDVRVANGDSVIAAQTTSRSRRGVLLSVNRTVLEARWIARDFGPCDPPDCRLIPTIH